jgi:TetR/AcrR family tetracycline transcriptional repressor
VALSRRVVVEEALKLVDSEGLDAVTLRALAARLGVQAPTLYWHVRNKAQLLEALADAIMDEAIRAITKPTADVAWREWLSTAAQRLRQAMLAHPDGARIVAGARASLRRADFSELAMATLAAHGVALEQARLTVLVVERYTVGFVLDEQSRPPDDVNPPDPGELVRRLPTAIRAITEYFESGRSVDDLFRDGLRLILAGSP